ncbi:MAG: endonuclease domain-containing protein [Propionibacteriales bacterium]|nr:endonuclease domain-containing protein [Propionibacteriales bacterium]
MGHPLRALTDESAIALHGLPGVTQDLAEIHLSQVDTGRARRTQHFRCHPPVPATTVTRIDGLQVVNAPVAVALVARRGSLRTAVMAADALLRRDHDRAALDAALSAYGGRPGTLVMALATPESESPGESWSRLVFHQIGIEQPRQQVVISDAHGNFLARVDFLIDDPPTVIEFDGMSKYEGANGAKALAAENRREDGLRELRYAVVRLTWADLGTPQRVRDALRRHGAA